MTNLYQDGRSPNGIVQTMSFMVLTDYRPNYYLTAVPRAAEFFSAGSNPYWRSNFLTL